MNIAKTIALAATLTLLAGTAVAGGGHANRGQNQAHAQQKTQRLLARFDQNHDGVLDASELEAMRTFRQQRRFQRMKRFDTSGDGQLDAAEKQAMKAARAQKKAEMLQRFDKNRNGQLEPGERQAARAAMLHTRVNQRYDRLLARFDANNDGALSQSEIAQAHAKAGKGQASGQVRGHAGGKRQRLQAADQNGDGFVTRAEFEQMARQRFQMRQKRWQHGS